MREAIVGWVNGLGLPDGALAELSQWLVLSGVVACIQLRLSHHWLKREMGSGYFLRGIGAAHRRLMWLAAVHFALATIIFEFFVGTFADSHDRPMTMWVAALATVLAMLAADFARANFMAELKDFESVETPVSAILRNPIFSVTRSIAHGAWQIKQIDSLYLHSRQGLTRLGCASFVSPETAGLAIKEMYRTFRNRVEDVDLADRLDRQVPEDAPTQQLFYLLVKQLGRKEFFRQFRRLVEAPGEIRGIVDRHPKLGRAVTPSTIAPPSGESADVRPDGPSGRRVSVGRLSDRKLPDPNAGMVRAEDRTEV